MKRIAAAGAKQSGVRKIKNHRLRHLRFLAPCSTQTPPCLACFLHPSWLQNFTLAPCTTQTPIFAPVLPAEFHPRPMLDTDSALFGLFSAPVLAAENHSRPMHDTDSALYDLIFAPVLPAEFGFVFARTPLLVMPHP
jgi:hypothetical protein